MHGPEKVVGDENNSLRKMKVTRGAVSSAFSYEIVASSFFESFFSFYPLEDTQSKIKRIFCIAYHDDAFSI